MSNSLDNDYSDNSQGMQRASGGGGGKMTSTRSSRRLADQKPYSRRSSLLERIGEKVKDFVKPSWFQGFISIYNNAANEEPPELLSTETIERPQVYNILGSVTEVGDDISVEMDGCQATFNSQVISGADRLFKSTDVPARISSTSSSVSTLSSSTLLSRPPLGRFGAPNVSQVEGACIRKISVEPTSESRFLISDSFGDQVERRRFDSTSIRSRTLSRAVESFRAKDAGQNAVDAFITGSDLDMTTTYQNNSETLLDSSSNQRSLTTRRTHNETKSMFSLSAFHDEPDRTVSKFSETLNETLSGCNRKSAFYTGKTMYGGVAAALKSGYSPEPSPYQRRIEDRRRVEARPVQLDRDGSTGLLSATARRMLQTLEGVEKKKSLLDNDSRSVNNRSFANDTPLTFTPSIYHQNSAKGSQGPPVRHLVIPSVAVIKQNRLLPLGVTVKKSEDFIPGVPETREALRDDSERNDYSGKTGGKMMRSRQSFKHYNAKTSRDLDSTPVSSKGNDNFTAGYFGVKPAQLPASDTSEFTFSIPKSISFKRDAAVRFNEGSPPSSSAAAAPSSTAFSFSKPGDAFSSTNSKRNGTSNVAGSSSSAVDENKSTASGSTKSSLSELFKAKQTANWTCSECFCSSPNSSSKCPACEAPRAGAKSQDKQPSLAEMFQKKDGEWICSTCSVTNKIDRMKCVACEELKPGSKIESGGNSLNSQKLPSLSEVFQKKEGDWTCPTCCISNKIDNIKCEACEELKPGSKTVSSGNSLKSQNQPSLAELFQKQKKEGDWSCPTCCVSNKADNVKCVACEELKPGSKTVSSGNILKSQNQPSLAELFQKQKKEGDWACPTCCVSNKADNVKCVACEELKPGVTKGDLKLNPLPSAAVNINQGGGFSFSGAVGSGFNLNSFGTTVVPSSGSSAIASLTSSATSSQGFKFTSTATSSSLENSNFASSFKFGAVPKETAKSASSGLQNVGPDVSRNSVLSVSVSSSSEADLLLRPPLRSPPQSSDLPHSSAAATSGVASVQEIRLGSSTVGIPAVSKQLPGGFTFEAGAVQSATSSASTGSNIAGFNFNSSAASTSTNSVGLSGTSLAFVNSEATTKTSINSTFSIGSVFDASIPSSAGSIGIASSIPSASIFGNSASTVPSGSVFGSTVASASGFGIGGFSSSSTKNIFGNSSASETLAPTAMASSVPALSSAIPQSIQTPGIPGLGSATGAPASAASFVFGGATVSSATSAELSFTAATGSIVSNAPVQDSKSFTRTSMFQQGKPPAAVPSENKQNFASSDSVSKSNAGSLVKGGITFGLSTIASTAAPMTGFGSAPLAMSNTGQLQPPAEAASGATVGFTPIFGSPLQTKAASSGSNAFTNVTTSSFMFGGAAGAVASSVPLSTVPKFDADVSGPKFGTDEPGAKTTSFSYVFGTPVIADANRAPNTGLGGPLKTSDAVSSTAQMPSLFAISKSIPTFTPGAASSIFASGVTTQQGLGVAKSSSQTAAPTFAFGNTASSLANPFVSGGDGPLPAFGANRTVNSGFKFGIGPSGDSAAKLPAFGSSATAALYLVVQGVTKLRVVIYQRLI